MVDASREVLAIAPEGETSNERLYSISVGWGAGGDDYYWLNQETKAEPVVRETIAALDVVRQTLRLEVNGKEPIESLQGALAALAGLKARLDAGSIPDPNLIHRAEGTFAQGVHKIVNSDHVSAETVPQLMGWIEDAGRFSNPEVQDDTEAQFESHASWGSPSARLEAAEAALDLCLKRPETYRALVPMIDRMLTDPHPAVRMNAALRLIRIWDMDREGFWRRAAHLIATEENRGVLDSFVCQTLGRVKWHGGAREAADLVLPLIKRCPASEARNASIREHLVQMTLQFWLRFDFEDAAEQVRAWFAAAVDNAEDVRDAIQWLREAYTAGLRGADDPEPAPQRTIAINLMGRAVAQAAEALAYYAALSEPTEAATARARSAMQIVDTACQQLYFSSGAFQHGEQQRPPVTLEGGAIFLHETAPVLRMIGEHGGPHTVYYLIQLLEHLVEACPLGVFDLIAFAVLRGGQQSGYQFESLAADLMVKLVGRYLADHKEIFDDRQRRAALVDTLETFVAAGWPSVRRLFYRLPEQLQ